MGAYRRGEVLQGLGERGSLQRGAVQADNMAVALPVPGQAVSYQACSMTPAPLHLHTSLLQFKTCPICSKGIVYAHWQRCIR